MRKTELWLGVGAGTAGVLLAVLSLFGVLPYSPQALTASSSVTLSAVVCAAANIIGIAGAVTVQRHHIMASAVMTVVMVVVLFFGFPWQSIPAVVYIMSVVLALVPVKLHTGENQGRTQS
jgi:hypothetical protein